MGARRSDVDGPDSPWRLFGLDAIELEEERGGVTPRYLFYLLPELGDVEGYGYRLGSQEEWPVRARSRTRALMTGKMGPSQDVSRGSGSPSYVTLS